MAAQLALGVVQKDSSGKAAGSEKSEAYGFGTLRASSNENAAGGLFQQPLRSNSARRASGFS